jgi:hypothetical protein
LGEDPSWSGHNLFCAQENQQFLHQNDRLRNNTVATNDSSSDTHNHQHHNDQNQYSDQNQQQPPIVKKEEPRMTASISHGNSTFTANLGKHISMTEMHPMASSSSCLDTVHENATIAKSMHILRPIQGVESWQTSRRYLIAPAALAACSPAVVSAFWGYHCNNQGVDSNSGDDNIKNIAQSLAFQTPSQGALATTFFVVGRMYTFLQFDSQ